MLDKIIEYCEEYLLTLILVSQELYIIHNQYIYSLKSTLIQVQLILLDCSDDIVHNLGSWQIDYDLVRKLLNDVIGGCL
jgi:hypothetical protein